MNPNQIGLVGVGLLGSALAQRLSEAGFQVLAYDSDPSRTAMVSGQNLRFSDSARKVAAECRRVVLCLPDSSVVNEVLWGSGPLAGSLSEGATVIDTTTGDPSDTLRTGQRLAERDISYMDATIVGSSTQVREGASTLLVGGALAQFEANRDVFSAWSDRVFHTGPIGSAALTKLLVNQVLGLNRLALAETLALAMGLELDQESLLSILKATPAYSRIMENKGPKMIRGDFSPEAKLAQHRKDVGLILELGRRAAVPLPVSETHLEMLDLAISSGWGELDNSAVIRAFIPADDKARP
ncbi:MAG: 2-(hydroxymethyl)glutarate dehydrogenase [bacterium]|nr:2-(hydroxymethyl)glutarate dehydrogenase [bacterium]